MLVGNGVRLNGNPMRQMAAPLAGAVHRAQWMQAGALRNRWTHTGADRLSGIPDGLRHPSSWLMAPTAGGMSARNQVTLAWSAAPLTLAAGVNITGSTTLTWTVDSAALQLVVSATGTATVTFSGAGTLSGALSAEGASSISFTVPTTTLGAVVDAIGTAAITWSSTGTIRAIGWMETDPNPTVELTAAAVATAVWTEVLESGLDAADVMRLLLAVAAGKTTIDGTTVAFRDQADTTDRVVAEMTGSERTTVTIDAS